MFQYLFPLKRFIPIDCIKTIYEIDYQGLYNQGKRVIFFDIDNTIGPYTKDEPSEEAISLIKSIKEIGYKIIVWSNNHEPRVSRYAGMLGVDYIYGANKPFKTGYKKYVKKNGAFDVNTVFSVGDQLITDVLLSNRLGIDCILVKPIERKDEKWYTRLNRKMADNVIRRMGKKYPEVQAKIRSIE